MMSHREQRGRRSRRAWWVGFGLVAALLLAADSVTGQRAVYVFRTVVGPATEGATVTDTTKSLRLVPHASASAHSPVVAAGDTAIVRSPATDGLVIGLADGSANKALKIWPSGGLSLGLTTDPGTLGALTLAGFVRGGVAMTSQVIASAATHHNYAIGANVGAIEVTASSGTTVLTGVAATGGNDGRILTVLNTGSGIVHLSHENTSSSAANRFQLPGLQQNLGLRGAAVFYHTGGGSGRWVAVAVWPGRPIPRTFSAGEFTANTGTWTVEAGDVVTHTYQQWGRLMRIDIVLTNTETSGSPTALRIAFPPGFGYTGAVASMAFARIIHAGAGEAGFFYNPGSASYFEAQRINSTAFSNATTHGVQGTFFFEVQ